MKLLPSLRVLCTPYNQAPCHFMQSHIRKVHACLAVTCHLHIWQINRGLLRATAVTRGWNGYQNKSQHIKEWDSNGQMHSLQSATIFAKVRQRSHQTAIKRATVNGRDSTLHSQKHAKQYCPAEEHCRQKRNNIH